MKQKNKQPKLRFPQFDGNWEEKRLGEIFKIKYGKPYTHLDFGKIPLLGTGGVIGYVNESLYNKPSVLIGRKGTINKPRYINTPFWTVDTLFYTEIKSNYATFFIYLLVCKINWLKYNEATGVPSLNTSSIKGVKVSLPSLAEQEKIADFFSTLDAYLGQKKQRLALLQEYKRGIMQQLFSGQKRFQPDAGGEFPAWEWVCFNKIYSFKKNNSLSRANLQEEKTEIENIHYGDIHTRFNTILDLQDQELPYIKEVNSKVGDLCLEQDLVIADASEDYNDIGKTIELKNIGSRKIVAGLHTFLARPKKDMLAAGFGGYMMASSSVRKQIKIEAQGAKVLGISKTRLATIKIPLPSIAEQKKIAEFLEALDDRIKLVEQSVAQLENWKKGLLQELLV